VGGGWDGVEVSSRSIDGTRIWRLAFEVGELAYAPEAAAVMTLC
jgi:hypothetical protein